LTLLHSFNSAADGANPYAGLVQASDGNLYGTTLSGGSYGYGTAFQLSNDETGAYTVFTVLHSFSATDAANPRASLVQASDGNLYGTTYQGGSYGNGTAFQLSKDRTGAYTVFTVLHSFGATGGRNPYASLVQASDGNLYGTTLSGGSYGYGTAFQLSKDGTGAYTVFTVLHSFNNNSATDGASPYASLVQASDGNLYGMTYQGGSYGSGTAFQLSKDGTGAYTVVSVLRSFNNVATNGGYPYAGLVQAADGNLYGTTWSGGSYGSGTAFQLSKDGTGVYTVFTVLHSFNNSATDGANPRASLVQASDGNLYGTTYQGGSYGYGTAFQLSKDGTGAYTVFTVLHSFNSAADGANWA
jgi:uncharacterized repeat protein (TIGR03803 family)